MGPKSRVSLTELGLRLETIHTHLCYCGKCGVHQKVVNEGEISNNEKENPFPTSLDLLDYFGLVGTFRVDLHKYFVDSVESTF